MLFERASDYFFRLENVSSRIEMTNILSELLKEVEQEEIRKLVYLCQGKVAPEYKGIDIGMGEKFIEEAIAKVSGHSKETVEKAYKKKGDLGIVAEELTGKKRQQSLFTEKLSITKVYENLIKISNASGQGSQEVKIRLLAELLNSASPLEARYITRFPLGNLRLGVGDPTIMDAIASVYTPDYLDDKKIAKKLGKNKVKDEEEYFRKVRQALREKIEPKYNICPDLGEIVEAVKEKGLKGIDKIKINHGVPIRPSLAERLPSSEEIIKKLGKCAVEAKYDGLRLQLHKKGKDVIIFSRKLENMTKMFPEIVEAARKEIKEEQIILEGEALAVNEQTSEFYPFQVTIQRRRKHGINKMAEDFPLRLFVFDVMLVNGKNLMNKPFSERRKIIEKTTNGKTICPTELITTDSAKEMEEFFENAVNRGLEGIIAKDLNAEYIAGARKFSWIKLKRSYKGELNDSIDVVIVGYFKGKGTRTKLGLGALLTAVYDVKEDRFKTIAKVGTGLSEEQITDLAQKLSKVRQGKQPARVDSEIKPDIWVDPNYVIEVLADEITRSPVHTTARKGKEGLALRFPRMISERPDRKAEDATTVKEIEKMFKNQKYVSAEE